MSRFSGNKKTENSSKIHLEQNSMQPESDFILKCFREPSSKQKLIALSIRRAIARLGEVDEELIHSESSFEELDLLPFWSLCGDAGFNTTRFMDAIQVEIGFQFTDAQLNNAAVRDPDLNSAMKIYEFIQDFYNWYASLPK